MEMFILSYANILYIYPKLSSSWFRLLAQNLLDKPVCYTLRYCSSNLCKWNYLYGDLPFFEIQVYHFKVQDKQFGANLMG